MARLAAFRRAGAARGIPSFSPPRMAAVPLKWGGACSARGMLGNA